MNTDENKNLFLLSFNLSELVSTRTFLDKDYYVVPVILIVEGVLNNLLYSSDELNMCPESWNGRPVCINHPMKDGKPISANHPDVIESQVVGCLFNTRYEEDKLKSEAWIEIDKLKRVSSVVFDRLKNNELLEVSTGLFLNVLDTNGVFNNKKYIGIAKNYKPDHLAILPYEKGACSIEDGAGMPRINQQEEYIMYKQTEAVVPPNETETVKTEDVIESIVDNIQTEDVIVQDNKEIEKIDADEIVVVESKTDIVIPETTTTAETVIINSLEDLKLYANEMFYNHISELIQKEIDEKNELIDILFDNTEIEKEEFSELSINALKKLVSLKKEDKEVEKSLDFSLKGNGAIVKDKKESFYAPPMPKVEFNK